MENKEFPEQEAAVPESVPSESLPAIEELTFDQPPMQNAEAEEILFEELPMESLPPAEIQADEEEPATEESILPEGMPISEEIPEADTPEEMLLAEEVPALDAPTEEQLLPDAADATEETSPSGEISPVESKPDFMERIPDVEADYPEEPVREPEEDETVSVLDIVNDPEFAVAAEAPQLPVDTNDQEYSDSNPTRPQNRDTASQHWATRKGRPKRKKGEGLFGIPNILVTFVWLALIVAIGVTLGRMLWICAADVLAFGREDKVVTITVYEADTMEDIVDKLHENGLIRYKSLFNLYASISNAEEDIKPGIYDLNTRYDYHALVNFMSPSSTREVIELTIPEGYSCRQIFALLEEHRVCTALDIASYAAEGELSDYWFLEELDRSGEYCLEGYLFPDTYQFYKNSSPREALEKMLDNFGNRFSEEMRAQLDTLNNTVTDGSFTINDVVIVASLIEKESAAATESPKIAGVIYNRLFNWNYPALLNIDAAIIYAQGGEADVIDTRIDSPYNTYRYTGLTPTPIANPGLSSLQAALNPETHNYYFYVLNPATSRHQFSTTQAEHDSWIQEFYH